MQRKRWAEAEAAYSEVIRVRPLRSRRGLCAVRFYAMRSDRLKAAADFAQALAMGDRDPELFADVAASDEVWNRVSAFSPAIHRCSRFSL